MNLPRLIILFLSLIFTGCGDSSNDISPYHNLQAIQNQAPAHDTRSGLFGRMPAAMSATAAERTAIPPDTLADRTRHVLIHATRQYDESGAFTQGFLNGDIHGTFTISSSSQPVSVGAGNLVTIVEHGKLSTSYGESKIEVVHLQSTVRPYRDLAAMRIIGMDGSWAGVTGVVHLSGARFAPLDGAGDAYAWGIGAISYPEEAAQ